MCGREREKEREGGRKNERERMGRRVSELISVRESAWEGSRRESGYMCVAIGRKREREGERERRRNERGNERLRERVRICFVNLQMVGRRCK